MVVSGEPQALARAVDSGALTVIDDREEGQSAAALLGLARVRELACERAMLVPGDCPLIDGRELRDLPPMPESLDVAIVARSSRYRHERAGARGGGRVRAAVRAWVAGATWSRQSPKGLVHEVVRVPCLELDVDTSEDASALADALARHPTRAPRTREALSRLAA